MNSHSESTATSPTGWIGVEDVAADLGISVPSAWELLRRWGVRMTDGRRDKARFRREDYESQRDAMLAPPTPRKPLARAVATEAATTAPTPRPVKSQADGVKKLKSLKSGRPAP